MDQYQKKLLNESLELLIKLDKKSMCLFSEDIKVIAAKIHGAYNGHSGDAKFEEAKALVIDHQQCSPSFFQRKLKIGYAAACELVSVMEANGVCGPFEGSKARKVLIQKT